MPSLRMLCIQMHASGWFGAADTRGHEITHRHCDRSLTASAGCARFINMMVFRAGERKEPLRCRHRYCRHRDDLPLTLRPAIPL